MAESFAAAGVSSQSNETSNSSVIIQTDDDEDDNKTCIIGELDVDDYFDDVFCKEHALAADAFADLNAEGGDGGGGESSSSSSSSSSSFSNTNDSSRPRPNDLETAHVSIVIPKKNKPPPPSAVPKVIPHVQRNAAAKANVNIASCLKRKRPTDQNEKCSIKHKLDKRRRTFQNMNNGKVSSFKEFGIDLPRRFHQIHIMDKHFLLEDNFILKLPADPTIYDMLTNYSEKKSVSPDVLGLVLDTFDMALPKWCIYRIEQLQYDNIIKKFPTRRLCQIYGLSHLIRFIGCLPGLFERMKKISQLFITNVSAFIKGFFNYMVEENIHINFNKDYDNVMPEYYRMTYWERRRIKCLWTPKI